MKKRRRTFKWSNFEVLTDFSGKIKIAKFEDTKEGRVYKSGSTDRTEEIIEAVMKRMRYIMDNNDTGKNYCGYEDPNIGKLIFIKPGYDFRIIVDRSAPIPGIVRQPDPVKEENKTKKTDKKK